MNKAKELRDKYESELEALQAICPHKEKQVIPNCWAPAHCWGEVEVCIECEKVIKNIQPEYEFKTDTN